MRAKNDVHFFGVVRGVAPGVSRQEVRKKGEAWPLAASRSRALIARIQILLLLGLILGGLAGCASTGDTPGVADLSTVDGLKAQEIDAPGRLFLRDGHQIGAYDAFMISESSIAYDRRSRVLPPSIEASFLATLEQSLYDAAEESQIPIVDVPGACVMEVEMRLANVVVDRARAARLGTMTLVMEFRDTQSGEGLLRYATQNSIQNEGTGIPRSAQFQRAFDEMVAEMDIAGPLQAAGLTNNATRPGCRGTLAERGRSGLPAVSAQ